MTEALEEVFGHVSKLPEGEQDALARLMADVGRRTRSE